MGPAFMAAASSLQVSSSAAAQARCSVPSPQHRTEEHKNFDAGPLPPTIAGRPNQNRPKPDLRSPSTPYDLLTYPQAVRSFGEFGARRDGKRRFRRQAGQQPRRETTAPQRLLRAAAEAERILTSRRMAEGMGFEPTIRL